MDFELNCPTALRFFERYSRICKFDEFSYNIGLYLIELALISYHFLRYKPSTLAGAAVYLSKKILQKKVNSYCENHSSDELITSCAKDIVNLIQNADTICTAVKKKFLSYEFLEVSKIEIS